jgi:hypothetical protein
MIERVRIPRRVMEEFRITELSSVDRPAQEHAKMAILKRDDPGRDRVLRLEHSPMSSVEQAHYAKLFGTVRREFLLADHAERTRLMKLEDNNNEDSDMRKFTSFAELQTHYQKSGMSGTLAARTARSARPDLFQKLQDGQHTPTDEEQIAKAARDGRSRQNAVQAEVDTLAITKGLTKTEATRLLRREKPELFA